jgi:extracellular factor (EF) 3-hydroxypalmitic acid methyl ester biosynthesis protein
MTVRDTRKPAVDSDISFQNSQGLLGKGTLISIANDQIVFEVYNPNSIGQISEVLTELKIRKNNTLVYSGRAIVIALVNTGLILIVSVKLEENWLGQLEHLDFPSENVSQFLEDWESRRQLLPDFRMAVEEMRSFLHEFNRWLKASKMASSEQHAQRNLDNITNMIWPKWIALMKN